MSTDLDTTTALAEDFVSDPKTPSEEGGDFVVALPWAHVTTQSVGADTHFTPLMNPEAWEKIISEAAKNRAWFQDPIWEAGDVVRRAAAGDYILKLWQEGGMVWDVWRGAEPVGLILFSDVRPGFTAEMHAVFFDQKLLGKRSMLLNAMDLMFQRYSLQAIRMQLPAYAKRLKRYVLERLGFKHEAEWKGASRAQAARFSRLSFAYLYDGKWNDAVLLSLPRDHFYQNVTKE